MGLWLWHCVFYFFCLCYLKLLANILKCCKTKRRDWDRVLSKYNENIMTNPFKTLSNFCYVYATYTVASVDIHSHRFSAVVILIKFELASSVSSWEAEQSEWQRTLKTMAHFQNALKEHTLPVFQHLPKQGDFLFCIFRFLVSQFHTQTF